MVHFVMDWGLMQSEDPSRRTITEYMRWWGRNRRTAFRGQEDFRDCFEDEDTPNRLLAYYQARIDWETGYAGFAALEILCSLEKRRLRIHRPPGRVRDLGRQPETEAPQGWVGRRPTRPAS